MRKILKKIENDWSTKNGEEKLSIFEKKNRKKKEEIEIETKLLEELSLSRSFFLRFF